MSQNTTLDAQTNPPHAPASQPSTRQYSDGLPFKDFHHHLKKGGTPWATLILTANKEISKNLPTFIESTPIKGRVILDLPKPDSITGVEVTLVGRIFIPQLNVQVVRDEAFFLKLTKTLWSKGDGTPPRVGDSSPSADGKLSGSYMWEFSFTLPETATLPHFQNHPFHLPGTLNGHGLRVTIAYRASMTILRGRFKSNDTLSDVPFAYVSVIRAPPLPFLQWESYQSGLPPMDPVDDPESWEALKPIILKGTAFNSRSATVKCSFFIAKPLVYVRGSFIPLYLELESDDSQLLAVLDKPEAIVLTLCRYLKDRNTRSNAEGNWTDKITWQMDDVEQAAWWNTPGRQVEGRNKISLNGELHLGADLPPSMAVGRVSLEYSLCMFPLEIAGFKPEIKKTELLQEQPIKIVTAFADHVRPVSQAPPGTKLRHVPTGRQFQPLRM